MERGRWTVADALHPDVVHLGKTRFLRATPGGLAAHAHPGAWEVVVVLSGTVEWWAGPERWTVGPGSYFLTRPGEPHGGELSVMNPCELRWLQVAEGRAAPWLAGVPRVGAAPPALAQAIDALLDEHARPGIGARSVVDAWVTVALASLRTRTEAGRGMEEVVSAIRASVAEPWPLSRMAAAAGYSVPRFCTLFRAAHGQPPARWLRHERIAVARRLLDEGASVWETAAEAGFATSQHFAAVFRAEVGLSPTAFARRGDSPKVTPESGGPGD